MDRMSRRTSRPSNRQLELLATGYRSVHGFTTEDVVTSVDLIVRALGEEALVPICGVEQTTCIEDIEGEPRILFRPDTPDLNHRLAHELGHVVLYEAGASGCEDEERAANYLAVALLVPPSLMLRAHAAFGEDYDRISAAFSVSKTSAVIRIGEVRTNDDRAVITSRRRNTIVSGPSIRRHIEIGHPGLVKVRLHGGIDEGRTAVRMR